MIFLLSKELSSVFSSTTVGKHQFFSTLSAPMFLVAQSYLTLCNLAAASQASLSIMILQARILGCLNFLLQVFPTQRSNLGLPNLQVDSLQSEPPGKSIQMILGFK